MKESRTTYASRNIVFGLAAKVLLMVLEFVSRAVFIQYLGEELLGINGVFANVIQLLSLAELGMNNVVSFSFYQPIANEDKEKIGALIAFYKKVYNAIALAVCGIGLCLVPFLKYLINTSIEIQNVPLIYLIFLADTVFSYLFVYKVTLLRADQKGYIATQYEMISNILRVVLQIISIWLFRSIVIYLIIKVVMSVFTNWITAVRVDHDYPYIRKTKSRLDKTDTKEMIQIIKSGFIYKIAGVLLNCTDNILISMIIGTVWVGYLTNYVTIMNGLSSFYTIIFTSLTASIGNLVVTETKEKKLEIFNIMLCVSAWLGIVFAICLYVLSGEFIALWIGEKYILDDVTVLSKVFMLYLSCTLQPLFCYREALGLYRKTKYAMLAAALINVVLSIIMGEIWGLPGILIASIIAMLSTYIWYEPIVMYRDCFEISSRVYFFQRMKELVLMLLGMLVLSCVNRFWVADTWIMWIIKACLVFGIVNLYCFFIYRNTKEFRFIYEKVKGKFAK